MPYWFWLLITAAGTALLGPPKAWDPVDPTSRNSGKLERCMPFARMAHGPGVKYLRPGQEKCDITVIANSCGDKPLRFRINGVEQLLDTGWSLRYYVQPDHSLALDWEFLNPVGGDVIMGGRWNTGCRWTAARR